MKFLFFLLFFLYVSSTFLDECSLYSGGDFTYSNGNTLYTSLLKYDIGSQTFYSPADVFNDAHLSSFYEQNDILYFSGNQVRVGKDSSIAVGSFDINSGVLNGLSKGLWVKSKSLPTENSDISPMILFAPFQNEIIVAGHFSYQTAFPNVPLVNIAKYNPTLDTFSQFPQNVCNDCSVIALTTDTVNDKIYVATMSTNGNYETQVSYYKDESWKPLINPTIGEDFEDIRILFDSFVLVGENNLFSLAYNSESGKLTDDFVQYYLVEWDVLNPDNPPQTLQFWQKDCQSNSNTNIVYPSIAYLSENQIIAAFPTHFCSSDGNGVGFQVYDLDLNVIDISIPIQSSCKYTKYFQVVNNDLFYLSDGERVVKYSYGSWETLIENVHISTIYYSTNTEELYVAYHYGYETFVQHVSSHSSDLETLFVGQLYAIATIYTVVEMPDNKLLIGGDFKYLGYGVEIVGAKFAAYWDGSRWNPTLDSNDNTYFAGWKLLSAEAVGEMVFGIADQGKNTEFLPVIRWREDDGWLYLYKRPEIIDPSSWDNTIGTVHVDHVRNQIYFGGQFTVGIRSGEVTSGAVVYSYLTEQWFVLPANLTKVSAFGSLNNHNYLQIGGSFTFYDDSNARHENYLILDVENQQILSDVPSISNADIHAFAPFPGEHQYSFLGGSFGTYGVEQLRYVGNIYSLSVVGNSPISSPIYTLASRNGGEILYAGGPFDNSISQFNIGRQEWSSLINSAHLWNGIVRHIILVCPNDAQYYSYDENWDDSSLLESIYSTPDCNIPLGAPDDYICPEPSISTGKIIGLVFTVSLTIGIIVAILFFAYKINKQRSEQDALDSVEYL